MIATGVVLFAISFALIQPDWGRETAKWIYPVLLVAILISALLVLAGVAIWLWRVAP